MYQHLKIQGISITLEFPSLPFPVNLPSTEATTVLISLPTDHTNFKVENYITTMLGHNTAIVFGCC